MRVALYCRVSTDEQAKHGLSIDTQLANLRAWAKANGHIVVGEYVDPGVSGKKPYTKRPRLSDFVDDLKNGLSVDALVFTKLDRFFRSVKLYYQAVAVLEKYHVAWQATQEDYETVTASGRMKVNIMLAVAENEADRTAERIKVVFERKVEMGEVLNPSGLPRGFSVEGKKVVPNEEAPAMKAAFEHYLQYGSIHATMDYLHREHGIPILYKSLQFALKNPLYMGEYRGNPNYCEPIISREMFAEVQRNREKRSVRKNHTHREYAFSGLVACACCGRIMVGVFANGYVEYRCQRAVLNHLCHNHKHIGEKKLENYLLSRVEMELDSFEAERKTKVKVKKPDSAKIQAKLDRLKDLYVDGLISKEQYLSDRETLTAPLRAPEPPQTDFEAIRRVITGKDFRTRYEAFTPPQRRALWRSILDRIEIDEERNIRLIFRP